MGRRPNPLILEFFERGAKLNDNSNRYHHRCKACGEDFPKGRIDSLTNHLTKKCPAISEAERINACLALHGINNASGRPKYDGLLHSGPNMGPNTSHATGVDTGFSLGQTASQATEMSHNHLQSQAQNQIWTPLETLAEVSRQIEANEKHDDHSAISTHDPTTEAVQTTLAAAIPNITSSGSNAFELQEQFTLENPPMSYNNQPQQEKKDATPQRAPEYVHHELSAEEQRIHQLLQSPGSLGSPSQTALSVAAAAATARLTSSLLDPQLLSDAAIAEQIAQAAPSTDMIVDYPEPEREQLTQVAQISQAAQVTPPPPPPVSAAEPVAPWHGMTYMSEDIHGPATVTDHGHQMGPNLKGGYRMNTTTSPDGRQKHSRAKFDKERRIEVQEVRRIGACIRCRILRKVCSKGTPCDTCKKVLSPRVWRTGCVRTKLSEFIDLYSAGVQVVMAQKRINGYKTSYDLQNTGVVVEASHFPESGHTVTFQVFQGYPREELEETLKLNPHPPVILLDNDREDIPGKVEAYMRNMLPEYITHEPSPHVRVTLQIADQIAKETNDELLKRSLELWGIVEMMDRERQWTMLAKSPQPEVEDHWIKDDTESEAYSNICMQLTAAAERKASLASRNLLNGIQRSLQDGKTRLGFPMFLTVMLFLNCLEKTTWAFKAWDQENLRPKWPLERPPGSYTNQGHGLTELLRMLLVIRHVLPKTVQSDPDVPIVAEGEGPEVKKYFQDLNVTPRYLRIRYHDNNFQPTDSRSLEFLFCAQLLLHAPPPHAELHPLSRGGLQETQQETHQEVPQEVSQEVPQVASQDMPEATSQEITQDA
ncbi:hypothetical protein F5B22DRAFT_623849 [Xylaria bambusicola]|uniref:uncharacterized protein n=1 Tax=Xylaria bambusicola TaxID=326684 RepID=UPI00200794E5|nr:uncharacterized protein F5B22DRAFT_623849 [Xylaria bambusicola]KAI0506482.1 hypothetical protein F5B22DRAFT_623849 [Xylaria bambusicola]